MPVGALQMMKLGAEAQALHDDVLKSFLPNSITPNSRTNLTVMAPSTPQNRLAQVASHVGTTSTALPVIPEVAPDSIGK